MCGFIINFTHFYYVILFNIYLLYMFIHVLNLISLILLVFKQMSHVLLTCIILLIYS